MHHSPDERATTTTCVRSAPCPPSHDALLVASLLDSELLPLCSAVCRLYGPWGACKPCCSSMGKAEYLCPASPLLLLLLLLGLAALVGTGAAWGDSATMTTPTMTHPAPAGG